MLLYLMGVVLCNNILEAPPNDAKIFMLEETILMPTLLIIEKIFDSRFIPQS